MAKKPSDKRIAEYDRLWLFVSIFYKWMATQVDPKHKKNYSNPLPDFWRAGYPFSQSFSGLKQAVGDVLGMTREATPEELKSAEMFLVKHNAPSLSEVLGEISSLIPKILKRKRIRNDQEYYLINDIVIDTAQERFNARELELASQILADYEFKQQAKNK